MIHLISSRLIIKSSFHIYILTQLKYSSRIFWLNSNTWVESHDSTRYQSQVESELVDSTWLVKQLNITSRELNIEIFSIFRLCIIFLIESHKEKHEEKHEKKHEEKHEEKHEDYLIESFNRELW